ncbi:MAG: response regulator [Verrucomicrobiaceae bacterium]|nr:response regulator [Verrucomicrobiaceae bacterium]
MKNPASDNRRVLVVDDQSLYREALCSLLRQDGYEARSAGNGREAWDVLPLWRPDLILLDVLMPEMDGFEFCASLFDDPDYQQVPVIFLSSEDDTASIACGFELGAVDYIGKPFRKAEVLARVRTHLNAGVERMLQAERLLRRTRQLEQHALGWLNSIKSITQKAAPFPEDLVDRLKRLHQEMEQFFTMPTEASPARTSAHLGETSASDLRAIVSGWYVNCLRRGVGFSLRGEVPACLAGIAPDVARRLVDESFRPFLDGMADVCDFDVRIRCLGLGKGVAICLTATPHYEPRAKPKLATVVLSEPLRSLAHQSNSEVEVTTSDGRTQLVITLPSAMG